MTYACVLHFRCFFGPFVDVCPANGQFHSVALLRVCPRISVELRGESVFSARLGFVWLFGACLSFLQYRRGMPRQSFVCFDMLKKIDVPHLLCSRTYAFGMNFPMFRFERFSARENPASGARPKDLPSASELHGQDRFWIWEMQAQMNIGSLIPIACVNI